MDNPDDIARGTRAKFTAMVTAYWQAISTTTSSSKAPRFWRNRRKGVSAGLRHNRLYYSLRSLRRARRLLRRQVSKAHYCYRLQGPRACRDALCRLCHIFLNWSLMLVARYPRPAGDLSPSLNGSIPELYPLSMSPLQNAIIKATTPPLFSPVSRLPVYPRLERRLGESARLCYCLYIML